MVRSQITDPAARRYFLTLDEAVNLLLLAASDPGLPALLAPHLPAMHYIAELARFMARQLAPGRDIPIHFTGLRAGDKLTERLWSVDGSEPRPSAIGILFDQLLRPSPLRWKAGLAALRAAVEAHDIRRMHSIHLRARSRFQPSHCGARSWREIATLSGVPH